jgi:hypothetical protein
MFRLTFLFVSITGFIALGHGWFFLLGGDVQESDSIFASRVQ